MPKQYKAYLKFGSLGPLSGGARSMPAELRDRFARARAQTARARGEEGGAGSAGGRRGSALWRRVLARGGAVPREVAEPPRLRR